MKTILIILGCLVLFSGPAISATKDTWIPYPNRVEKIELLPYTRGDFDCTNKCALLIKYYREHGLIAKMLITWGGKFYYYRYDYCPTLIARLHAQVVVWNVEKQQWYLVDPTSSNNVDGLPIKFNFTELAPPEFVDREMKANQEYFESVLRRSK